MRNVSKFNVNTDNGSYSERNLMQLIRRKMTSRVHESKKKYKRIAKHKKKMIE